MVKTHNETHDGWIYEVRYEKLRKAPLRGDIIDNGDGYIFLFTGIKRVILKHEWFYDESDGMCRWSTASTEPEWFMTPCGTPDEIIRMLSMSNRHLVDRS